MSDIGPIYTQAPAATPAPAAPTPLGPLGGIAIVMPRTACFPGFAAGALSVGWSAVKSGSGQPRTITRPVGPIEINLSPGVLRPLLPWGVQFSAGGARYFDRGDGVLYSQQNFQTGVAIPVGAVDYQAGYARITTPPAQPITSITLEGLMIGWNVMPVYGVTARITTTPIKTGVTQIAATTMDGRQITGSDNGANLIAGDEMTGSLDYQTGIYSLLFGKKVADAILSAQEKAEPWYDPDDIDPDGKIFRPTAVLSTTVRLATVGYTYLPLSAEILGLNPVRLPPDGRIPIYRSGDVAVAHHTDAVTVSPIAGAIINLNRPRLTRLDVRAADGVLVPATSYSADLDDGLLTWAQPLDTQGYPTPWTIYHSIEEARVITDVEITGRIVVNLPFSYAFPSGSRLSGALVATQDLAARVSIPFTQYTWTGVWSDGRIGDGTDWQYDYANYPIEVVNVGARQDRWAIIFESPTTFRCVGERSGEIARGISRNADFSPANPATANEPGGPYPFFIIRAAGWGGGQGAQQALRFNTYASNYPVAIVRSIRPGPPVGGASSFKLIIRGNTR